MTTKKTEAPASLEEGLAALRAEFPPEAIGKLPRSLCSACSKNRGICDYHPTKGKCEICGNYHNTQAMMHIDFVGHADVTARLLSVDPTWTWEPMGRTPDGRPALDPDGGLWINLTVLGVTRPGYGDTAGGKGVKEAVGDAIRNAAMRFGVALGLWAKGDREWAKSEKHGAENSHPDQAQPQQETAPEPWNGPTVGKMLEEIDAIAQGLNMTYADITARWRSARGDLALEQMEEAPPHAILSLLESIRVRAAEIKTATEGATDGAS